MKKLLFLVLFTFILSAPAYSVENKTFTPEEEKKIQVYKNFFKTAMRKEGFVEFKKWFIKRDTSLMDDSKTVIAALNSEDTFSPENKNVGCMLLFSCYEHKTVAAASYADDIDARPISVEYRIDKNKSVKETWLPGVAEKGLAKAVAPKSIEFIRSLVGAKQLIFRLNTSETNTFIFDLDGIDEIVPEIENACEWKK